MKTKILTGSMIAAYALLNTSAFAEETILDPIVVSADFREAKLSETTNSVTVIGEEEIYDKASQSFIETLSATPNVNFTAGASKAKYIQIRGIGERSQYETPVNPSVGLIVDGIDFSSSALGVSMFDVKQIEILRGPQGTTFGANGMAGVIAVVSNDPTKETEGHVEATVGNYNTKAFGAAVGGTLLEDTLIGRLSVYKNTSDGFMENSYLDRKDTNKIDELTAKVQLRWFASENHTMDFNIMHVDVENGFDAFTFDNSRVSLSDEPGEDTQKTDAFAVKSTYGFNTMKLITTLSYSKSDMTYSYDEDWSYLAYHEDAWRGLDEFIRDKKQIDFDARMISDENSRIFNQTTDWTFGAYYKDYSDDLLRDHLWSPEYTGDYQTKNKAIYGQFDTHVSKALTVTTGVRIENVDASYIDSSDFSVNTDETLVGGKLGLNYKVSDNILYYTTLSRGYKPGGVNANNEIPTEAREFRTETLWNIDLGMNSSYLDNKLISRLNLFYGKRKDQQVKSSLVENANDGESVFNEYFTNAAEGHYYGLEAQVNYTATDNLHLFANLGLLKSKFDEYIDPNPDSLDVTGRTPAQSPEYQYNVGVNYMLTEIWMVKANVEGKGSYYFSNRHNAKSDAYTFLNSSIEYIRGNWNASLWMRNITDEESQVRGFGSFGNNPVNGWVTEVYTQQGAPRTVGLTVSYDF